MRMPGFFFLLDDSSPEDAAGAGAGFAAGAGLVVVVSAAGAAVEFVPSVPDGVGPGVTVWINAPVPVGAAPAPPIRDVPPGVNVWVLSSPAGVSVGDPDCAAILTSGAVLSMPIGKERMRLRGRAAVCSTCIRASAVGSG